ncbi:AAA-domain-containing protein [Artomyces pyxidatus]|uniref:AAA-domain-containing protein n=1 Tax=Artomyces pyxidatus TaxID=48021 RepID=A0ACB8SMT5_9AGAM|nr:AAA-domain-containing protein [Artomyces pyxidatus]
MSSPASTVKAALALKPREEFAVADTVLLGADLWDCLVPAASQQQRIALSIAPVSPPSRSRAPGRHRSSLASLACWAIKDDTHGLTVPAEWTKLYGRVFGSLVVSDEEKTHTISSLQLIPLEEVYVQALSPQSYHAAKADISSLENWFCTDQRILRQGSPYFPHHSVFPSYQPDADAPQHQLKYSLIMTEPVLQGYAQKGRTTFILLPPPHEEPRVNGHTDGVTSSSASEESDFSDEDVEIDEGFLASSVAPQTAGPNGVNHDVTSTGSSLSRPSHEFVVEPLPSPIHSTLDDHTLYIRTADLSKLGILDGDWAVVWQSASSNRRVVRLEANDGLVESIGCLIASPILLHNIDPDFSPSHRFHLQASPEGIHGRALPTAKAVTIARVASRLSTNRVYQPLVLQALKSSFEGKRRLVRQGDLLAVKVDVDQLPYMRLSESAEGDAPEVHSGLSTYPARSEQIIYFIVTNVDCDSPVARNGLNTPDINVGLAVGELGCWVDSSVTRMIQTGIEHTRIPDATHFLGMLLTAVVIVADVTFVLDLDVALPAADMEEKQEQNNYRAFQQIRGLASAALLPQALSYDIPISFLLKGARGIGKFTTTAQVASRLGMHLFEVNCYDFLSENDAKTEGVLRARFEQATSCAPCIFVLRHIDAFAQTTQGSEPGHEPAIINVLQDLLKDLYGSWRLTGYPILVCGTTSEPSRVPTSLLACFKHEVSFEAPGEPERSAVLQSLLASKTLAPDVSIVDLARRTAAFVAGDLDDLVTRTSFTALTRAMLAVEDGFRANDLFLSGIALTKSDFDIALDEARSSYSQNIGAPTIPNVSWDDVGGLADVKADILDTVQLPLEHPELFAQDLKKRSGILLYGPPGTGKTLLAKAVATTCALNFFSVKGPELLNMYIGESEANVRRVFQRARDARPCVVFFDELDSVAPKRGAHGDSGGVMDRIVSQLLAELDGIAAGAGGDVFVIGATNRPDLLDPALLRPGRFDRMLYLGVSDTDLAQLKILQALTRKFRLDPALDLLAVAQQCPFNFTGADFYALCSDALLKAMSRKAEEIDAKLAVLNAGPASDVHPHPLTPQYYLAEMASPADIEVVVSQLDFDNALRELTPSVSQAEMAHYAKIQQRFSRKPEADEIGKGKGKGKAKAVDWQ